ncbi:OmpA family protein [Marinovum sp. 2_MG-2023]|uniref:OmpA family protein n=1 Tax=unclassified Marinovum TaxID=2647166 RepID=UPI0026E20637|nr:MULTISPECIES: OmpA family protein [unclassified Marinovum]MDO6731979.1 OmpA family protein [Marinovum sp. 2_MG-2023]MDO6781231.1 OmpA family protein [Marinovum sp. 1_MG-2023]
MRLLLTAVFAVLISGSSAIAQPNLASLPIDADRCAIAFALTGKALTGCAPPPAPQGIFRSTPPNDGYMVQFSFDSESLSKPSRAHLDRLAGLLNGPLSDLCLMLVGHADSVGAASYNQALSNKRAATVRLYMAGPGSVAAARIHTGAKGESQPLPNLDPADGRNRRVEILARPRGDGGCG